MYFVIVKYFNFKIRCNYFFKTCTAEKCSFITKKGPSLPVMLSVIVTLVRLLQSENAYSPISVKLSGTVTLTNRTKMTTFNSFLPLR